MFYIVWSTLCQKYNGNKWVDLVEKPYQFSNHLKLHGFITVHICKNSTLCMCILLIFLIFSSDEEEVEQSDR